MHCYAKSLWWLQWLALLGACAITPHRTEPSRSVTERPAECQINEADAAWLAAAIANWRVVGREKLLISPDPLPLMIMTDAGCQYASRNLSGGRIRWSGEPHKGSISLPDGSSVPLGVTAFAKPLDEREGGFFVMALPSVWRAAGVQSAIGLERLMDGVLFHELMHAYQFYFANPRIAELTRRYGLPDTIGDDSLQETFESDPTYVSVYEAERDFLYQAAAASDDHQACQLASRALNKMRDRRSRWFTGESAYWADLDEIFLLMEGVGQWAMYAWYVDPRGGGVDREIAIRELRRNGRYWTQDAGLALFLVIDRLLPGWQRLAFAHPPATGTALLAQAVEACSGAPRWYRSGAVFRPHETGRPALGVAFEVGVEEAWRVLPEECAPPDSRGLSTSAGGRSLRSACPGGQRPAANARLLGIASVREQYLSGGSHGC